MYYNKIVVFFYLFNKIEPRYGPVQSNNAGGNSGKDKYQYTSNNNKQGDRDSPHNYSHNSNNNNNNNYNSNKNRNSFYEKSRSNYNTSDEVLRTPTRQTKLRPDSVQPGLQMSSTIRETAAHAAGSFLNQWNKNHPQQHSVSPYGLKESPYMRPGKWWQLFANYFPPISQHRVKVFSNPIIKFFTLLSVLLNFNYLFII